MQSKVWLRCGLPWALALATLPGWAQGNLAATPQIALADRDSLPDAPEPGQTGSSPIAPAQAAGSITGTVTDVRGGLVAGARIALSGPTQSGPQVAVSDPDGHFRFDNVPPGSFSLTVNAAGLAIGLASGELKPGETFVVPTVSLPVPAAYAKVDVVASESEIAEAQVEMEEKQRVLGIFPNFYASYIWTAAPMTTQQKYRLALRASFDPVSFGMTGVVAGIEQANDDYASWGTGASGFGKRYGASFGDGLISTVIAGAVLPSLFHQDPRYFVKGTGTVKSRIGYALAQAFVCRGDNGKREVNYSNMLGDLASGAISNAYYPAANRNGIGLTFGNTALGIGGSAISGVIQEFLLRKMTPHIPNYGPGTPGAASPGSATH